MKSPEISPAIVLATPVATATQKGPIDSGLQAQMSSDPPSRSPDAKTPARKWSRWIDSASSMNDVIANGRLSPMTATPSTPATIRNARLTHPPRSALERACRLRARSGS